MYSIDISYEKKNHAWQLKEWSINGGDALNAVSSVTKSAINGEVIPDKGLLQIPIGTHVQPAGKPQYIKLAGGRKREIDKSDYKYGDPTYEELLKSRPGKAIPTEFVELYESMSAIAKVSEQERKSLFDRLTSYLGKQPRPLVRHVRLVESVQRRLRKTGLNQQADELAETCSRIAEPFRKSMLSTSARKKRVENPRTQDNSGHSASLDSKPILPKVTGHVDQLSKNGHVLIAAGSSDGVRRGMEFDVFNSNRFRGRIEVVKTAPNRSVARIGYATDPIEQNDHIVTLSR